MKLDIETLGDHGDRVVMVHGSLNDGRAAFSEQRSLAGRYRLVIVNRRGYGNNPPVTCVDPEADAQDIVELLEDGAHVVGTSMGGVVSARAAALAPDRVRSLTLIEPPAFPNAAGHPVVAEASLAMQRHWASSSTENAATFLDGFAAALQMPLQLPSPLPPGLTAATTNLKTETPWATYIPLAQIKRARFPKLIVSGQCSPVFEAICDTLAAELSAQRAVFPGSTHAVQRIGKPFNDVLEQFWQSAARAPA
ncbi:alpha/beta hydrolase [Burkholderia sp. AU30198]|uniref:alpha/beta fold hydrolase n=1 Tax=Burkholderia sp. AU30198 TaxID=2879627 RepID=UPI001CF38A6D|nr:alpha/beta hydrolase [Burkholderia sp. AU30198]MCA8294085.1 alpha/beta hydrolase [Burkholderia sp. AU30198]